MPNLEFIFVEADSVTTERVFVDKLIIAGWTGRNKDAVEKHIAELEEIGVPRPKSTPIFYHLSSDQLTQNDSISVVGENSSGEVEFFILSHKEALWIGVGSDHTDRKLETYNVTLSKQVCSKPIAKHLWRYDEILKHWEKIKLRSYLKEGEIKSYTKRVP